MITIKELPTDLPPENTPVVIRVMHHDGSFEHRVEARDRVAFKKEFRKYKYDKHNFLLDASIEKSVTDFAYIPEFGTPNTWISPAKNRPNFNVKVLCWVQAKNGLSYYAVRYRTTLGGDDQGFRLCSFDSRVLRWMPIDELTFHTIY